MTAAFADDEYEVPPHGSPPAEAVELAEQGNVVYLTRHGERTAAVVPPKTAEAQVWAEKLVVVQAIADNPARSFGLRAWAQRQIEDIKVILNSIEADAEDDTVSAEVRAALRAGAPTTPHEEIVRRYT